MTMIKIIFTLKDKKLYVPVVTLSARDNQKSSKLLSKGFEWSVSWSEYETRSENENTTNECRYFLESNFVRVNRLFVLVYSNVDDISKKAKGYYLPKGIINNYNVIIDGKIIYSQPTDSHIKQYEEIRKLTTQQGEDYTPRCLLYYDYIQNHYRLLAVDLNSQKELDADPKAIQQIELVGQSKNEDGIDADEVQSVIILTILEKNKRTKIKVFSRKCNSIINNGKLSRSKS